MCDESHRFGRKVAAHAISEAGIWNCIKAGVDTIEHGHFLTESVMGGMIEREYFGFLHCMYIGKLQLGRISLNMR